MLITEMIKRLTEVKNICGDLPLFFFQKDKITDITHPEIIVISKGNSTKIEDGVYFRVPEEEENERGYN